MIKFRDCGGEKRDGAKLKHNNQILIDLSTRRLYLRLQVIAVGSSPSTCGLAGRSNATIKISHGSSGCQENRAKV